MRAANACIKQRTTQCTTQCRLADDELIEQLGLAFNRRVQGLVESAPTCPLRRHRPPPRVMSPEAPVAPAPPVQGPGGSSAAQAPLIAAHERLLPTHPQVQELINTALNAGAKADLSPVMQKLTLPEKRLLEAGRESTTNFEKWRSRKAKMESSQLVKRTKADTNTQRSSRQRR